MSDMSNLLANKATIITGANQGLGFEISKKYLESGADLLICARSAAMLETSRAALAALAAPGQKVVAKVADVSDQGDVQALVDEAMAQFGRVDILVNNAGVYGPKGASEDVDWAEWVRAIEINLFGSILMCRAVLPHFKAAGRGKIIQLSGGGATNPLPMISAYAVSKAAIIRFIETLAEEVRGLGIDVNAIAPGALNTRMLAEILEAGPEKVGRAFYERSLKQRDSGGAPLDKGADLAVFLGSSLSDGITGKLISAVWDPWSDLPGHLEELNATDIYTLRRIVPKDRGMDWGD
jgi:3-oxoacyl-[acyl-carrier protein] reductase